MARARSRSIPAIAVLLCAVVLLDAAVVVSGSIGKAEAASLGFGVDEGAAASGGSRREVPIPAGGPRHLVAHDVPLVLPDDDPAAAPTPAPPTTTETAAPAPAEAVPAPPPTTPPPVAAPPEKMSGTVEATSEPPAPPPTTAPPEDQAARLGRAFAAAVPEHWRLAIPVRLEVIEGTTSWAHGDGRILVAQSHASGDFDHLGDILAHEFGHHIAFTYGTGAYAGAAPEGWPAPAEHPEEAWADCVQLAFTGRNRPSHGLAVCGGDQFEWAAAWLAAGPPAD